MEKINDAIDVISKVEHILDFLTNEVENDGLCWILGSCQDDLKNAKSYLEIARAE
jgi:hypothetical protein